ncbi:MAG: DUF1003 domain-containing protein [Candidatus Sungbacteria bacterium]|uniref:DUF1003 domain-containing protein n=1 Tax=Candidatus Sungiibacteriota bacterium TaxID=2750080 RepID=A0A931WNZ5_9BACT|nr:DUF1003 domain-containing protein [Candidatus Sungbacteria bacterium]
MSPLYQNRRRLSEELAKQIAELNSQKFSQLDRFALWINKQIGSFRFFLLLLAWTVLWLAWNSFGPDALRFDPFPAFVLWLFISNMIQLLFLPLLMVGQELESRRSDLRAEIDFEINRRAEEENREILKRLEEQQREIHQLLKNQ